MKSVILVLKVTSGVVVDTRYNTYVVNYVITLRDYIWYKFDLKKKIKYRVCVFITKRNKQLEIFQEVFLSKVFFLQEQQEREWRKREEKEAIKKAETEAILKKAREEQIRSKQHFMAVEVQRDRREFDKVLR